MSLAARADYLVRSEYKTVVDTSLFINLGHAILIQINLDVKAI